MDLLRRSMTGIIVYGILLPGVFWPFNFHLNEPQLTWGFAVAMFLISLTRLVHWFTSERMYRFSPSLWRNFFIVLSLSHAGVLSLFFAMAMFDARFEPILHITMLAIGGIASGAIVALMPNIKLALANVGVLLIPSITAGFFIANKLPYSIMLLVYLGFIGLMGARSSKEYKRSFQIEKELDEQKKALEQLNKIDALTGIYNRGYFNIEFVNQWQQAGRNHYPLALLLIDIDHFKQFNDEQGHLCGDACLVHIANIISKETKRKTDLVSRFGGEEFVVLLPGCDAHEAEKVAETIRAAIASVLFVYGDKKLSVTASLGAAAFVPNKKIDSNVLIEAADKAMYSAKKAGRNRVVLADSQQHLNSVILNIHPKTPA